jgi:hypothetical protein
LQRDLAAIFQGHVHLVKAGRPYEESAFHFVSFSYIFVSVCFISVSFLFQFVSFWFRFVFVSCNKSFKVNTGPCLPSRCLVCLITKSVALPCEIS